MYAIMRVESTYRDYVVSSAGAIGYIQVMPLTGAKLADILEREDYSPKDLEDPQINLQYGTHYFSMLMRRFGYAYPLAAASYNGGPHNVSRWLKNLKDIRLDQFVEHIAFDESRIYAKKVSTHYANYVELYEGHTIKIPWEITTDDASIVDF
jgi:soluble lytic murein transglycosylase